MAYFTTEFQRFFKELSRNNNKAWFDSNRQRYEEHVKQPFASFVTTMIESVSADDSEIKIAAKDAIFRINRDVRFSKEKSPYNTYVAANISREGRKSKEWPGFYFQFAADRVTVVGGSYMVEAPGLLKIRRAIVKDLPAFAKLIKAKDFVARYGSLVGEKNKIVPPEFKEWVVKEPLVANKQFYFTADLDAGVILKKDLPNHLMNYYSAGKGINAFLKRALGSK